MLGYQTVPDFTVRQIFKQLRKKIIYLTCIYNIIYHLHITQNGKVKKIWAELLLYVVYTNFRRV